MRPHRRRIPLHVSLRSLGRRARDEDAGVLAVFLFLADEVNTVLLVYECVRKEKVEAIRGARRGGGWCYGRWMECSEREG